MKPRERSLCALSLEEPDRVPTFEIAFQYPEKIVGESFRAIDQLRANDEEEADKITFHNTRILAKTYKKMGYDIIRPAPLKYFPNLVRAIKLLKEILPEYMVMGSVGGTLGIPLGSKMSVSIIRRLYIDPEGLKREILKGIKSSIESIKKQAEAGVDVIINCTDLCLKDGPFFTLKTYEEMIFPFIKMQVKAAHRMGIYYILHSDGNLWSILSGLVDTGIDALHSIDPTAGMKLKDVKEIYGDKIALCGNVDAAYTMAYGTPHQVEEEAKKCIRNAAEGGGYILTTSNCIYKGIPPINALTLVKACKKYGRYKPY